MPMSVMQGLVQAAEAVKESRHAFEYLGLGIAYGVGKIFDRRLGKRRDDDGAVKTATLGRIERNVKALTSDFDEIADRVRDLNAHIVGPDGQNGIRGDVRELKEDVKGILNRERERADRLHGPYLK